MIRASLPVSVYDWNMGQGKHKVRIHNIIIRRKHTCSRPFCKITEAKILGPQTMETTTRENSIPSNLEHLLVEYSSKTTEPGYYLPHVLAAALIGSVSCLTANIKNVRIQFRYKVSNNNK